MISQEAMHNLARDMLRDRETVLRKLIESLEESTRIEGGCAEVLANFDEYDSDADLRKQLKTAIKSNRRLAAMNMRILAVLLVYVTSKDFQLGAATLMGRLGGDPMEVLREMMGARKRDE